MGKPFLPSDGDDVHALAQIPEATDEFGGDGDRGLHLVLGRRHLLDQVVEEAFRFGPVF